MTKDLSKTSISNGVKFKPPNLTIIAHLLQTISKMNIEFSMKFPKNKLRDNYSEAYKHNYIHYLFPLE